MSKDEERKGSFLLRFITTILVFVLVVFALGKIAIILCLGNNGFVAKLGINGYTDVYNLYNIANSEVTEIENNLPIYNSSVKSELNEKLVGIPLVDLETVIASSDANDLEVASFVIGQFNFLSPAKLDAMELGYAVNYLIENSSTLTSKLNQELQNVDLNFRDLDFVIKSETTFDMNVTISINKEYILKLLNFEKGSFLDKLLKNETYYFTVECDTTLKHNKIYSTENIVISVNGLNNKTCDVLLRVIKNIDEKFILEPLNVFINIVNNFGKISTNLTNNFLVFDNN